MRRGRGPSPLAVMTVALALLLAWAKAHAQFVSDPVVIDTRLGLQCDVAANRAYLRLGTGARGGVARYTDLPPEAPTTSVPVIDLIEPGDSLCRLRDGTEIRLRRGASSGGLDPYCSSESIAVWVAGRLVLGPGGIYACMLTDIETYENSLHGIGWIISPTRIDTCLRNGRHLPGPATQCQVFGDPRLMGMRDWLEYPVNGRRRQGSSIGVQYALDAAFCRRFIKRGANGASDELVVPRDFDRPVFVGGQARFDIDNDGEAEGVSRDYSSFGGTTLWTERLGRDRAAGRDLTISDAFFHRGKTYLLMAPPIRFDSMASDIGQIILLTRDTERSICRFRDAGGEGDSWR
jgi:hypothetical protein